MKSFKERERCDKIKSLVVTGLYSIPKKTKIRSQWKNIYIYIAFIIIFITHKKHLNISYNASPFQKKIATEFAQFYRKCSG